MCGIVGIANANSRAASREIIERMNACIVHRGPDDDGFYVNENVGLAMRRLSIIDIAHGQQPIRNQDKTAWIVFNGEIYNFQELRANLEKQGDTFYTNSDTEVILHLYDKYGADCVQYLRGMFAFAIWDERDKSLFVARDRVGKKPLLYSHQSNGDLIFGSEFRALLAHPDISREVDYEAIDSYLSYLYAPAPLTAFKQIRKLEPAHWLRWKDGKITTKRYWQPDFSKKIKISETEAEEETLRILRESTKLRMISEVPLGAFLSGGVDSSTVVALMAQESSRPVKTFSIGFEEQDFSELKYARKVAEHVGAEYNEFIVKPDALEVLPTLVEHYGEPYADPSALATYYVSRETRKYVTVALNGDGGDESFAGYERHLAMQLGEKYHRLPSFLRQTFIEKPIDLLPISAVKRSRMRDAKRFLRDASLPKEARYSQWVSTYRPEDKLELYSEEFRQKVADYDSYKIFRNWFEKANGSGILGATLLADMMTYLPNDLLVKVDIASMAVSLEARSPFLDHNLIEFAASLPDNLKIKNFELKYLLKKIAAKLVPPEVVYRRKMGFGVPVSHWFRGEMKDFVKQILLSEKFARRGIANPQYVGKLIEEHTSGKQDHGWKLWILIMLELWFQKFID
ncbi:MAG: asparagine synthase (glutamine-hydrolyzing) [Acidobacteria bacterium]|nr:asparagine synthase (glutamine-hydrolyzing) [Acidobacteriota bacterium]MCA1638739.1 asparagine synthase (glutamine-hydrolyzing) [Acidobacteriota bacterium]